MCRYECLGSIILLFQDIADSIESRKPSTVLHGYAAPRFTPPYLPAQEMLHEILLALSGHRSPLLASNSAAAKAGADSIVVDGVNSSYDEILTPPERQLLRTAEHISTLHSRLASRTAQISAAHKSVICRAVSTGISTVHLAGLQRKILEVEESILQNDAALVGAYNIVPLTAVVGEFAGWTRRLEWLWELTGFMIREEKQQPQQQHDGSGRYPSTCDAAALMDRLRAELQTGYPDIEKTAQSLVQVAETAWLRQLSAWIFYGRMPTAGGCDFFVEKNDEDEQGYSVNPSLLPSFVTPSCANSILFVGVSLDRLRSRRASDWGNIRMDNLSSEIQHLTSLSFPLKSVALARAVASIRTTLSRTTLQKLLPVSKVFELLQLLRDFLLLGRGEFAMALTQQADEKVRSRWKRTDGLAYEKRDGLNNVVIKEGEVSATLARTMAFVGTMQGEHAEEDEGLELARDLLRLTLAKSKQAKVGKNSPDANSHICNNLVQTPFCNLLFSAPVVLTMNIPEPLDLFLSESDLQVYTTINSYLMSVRRAHLRLTDLWKISSLRRQHPAPPRAPHCCTRRGAAHTRILKDRWASRSSIMRSPWTTCSSAIFFLAETEAYMQVEVVEGLWEDFRSWLAGEKSGSALYSSESEAPRSSHKSGLTVHAQAAAQDATMSSTDSEVVAQSKTQKQQPQHDPQSLAIAHRRYLKMLTRRLLLTRSSFTDPLYNLLIHLDHLVALVHRLHGIWASMDLEEDEGVVDAFSNLAAEERDVRNSLREVERKIKAGVEDTIGALRELSIDSSFLAEMEGDDAMNELDDEVADHGASRSSFEGGGGGEGPQLYDDSQYRPKRIGGIERLLMKLDFGVWFRTSATTTVMGHDEYNDA
ncbi:Spc98 family-domain-containing protein [Microdochium bolleyi]|uniref:Spindle pole body component n=1 Tax=Microdochium bolleyi TaxID=196109 RepID=A0A136ILK6_9PEZI|nr:Spc98 family-domain-containing protein [Microdochium bolleyi]